MIRGIDQIAQKRKYIPSKPIKLAVVITLILVFTGCNYSGFRKDEPQQERISLPTVAEAEIIPTDKSSAFLHSVQDIILGNPEFDAVEDILKTYGVLPYLRQPKAFTLFIPRGSRFDRETCEYFNALFLEAGTQGIVDVFYAHAIDGRYDTAEIMSEMGSMSSNTFNILSLDEEMLTLSVDLDGVYTISNKGVEARISIFDQMATNGIVHGIDHWLVPIGK